MGKKWGAEEKQQWLENAVVEKSYRQEVLERIFALSDEYRVEQYGALSCDPDRYPLYAVLTKDWAADRPVALITAGVHGYEVGGVYAALDFLEHSAREYSKLYNIVVVPSVSPWGFETNNRWNPYAVDPNRSFAAEGRSEEASLLKGFVSTIPGEIAVHIDLHETTDRDRTVFRPALAARDGVEVSNTDIPQGFYLVGDEDRPELEFQEAVINAVEKVTPIAPPDEFGNTLGKPEVARGVILYPMKKAGLSGILTNARFHTTTEIYPDGDWMTPESSVQGQLAAVYGALDYAAAQLGLSAD